jgi:hypothetical protein
MPKKSFYPKTPSVPEKAMVASNPMPVSYGGNDGRIVDANPGVTNAWGHEPGSFGHPPTVHAHGFRGSIRKGHHTRTSGHGGAHQIGVKKVRTKG